MLRFALCLFLAATITCHQYTPLCQNWCCEQQPIVYPQMCNSYCGSYSGSCNPCVPKGPQTTNAEWLCPVDIPIQNRPQHMYPQGYQPPTKCHGDTECPQFNPNAPSKCCYDAGVSYQVCKPAIRAPN